MVMMTKKTGREEILRKLKSLANPKAVEGMTRFGINPSNTYGISIPVLRAIAKTVGKDHELAKELWLTNVHEARIIACLIEKPENVTEEQMDKWVNNFDSWDVCDQCCGNLFDKTEFAYKKAAEWSLRDEEFVKRAGFVMMAELAVHDKKADDKIFLKFLSLIKRGSNDDRNFVKKAVNWGLRQIGKRNETLNKAAIEVAKEIQRMDTRTAKWIAYDALRELTHEKIRKKLAR